MYVRLDKTFFYFGSNLCFYTPVNTVVSINISACQKLQSVLCFEKLHIFLTIYS